MDELLQQAAGKFGIDVSQARGLAGAVFKTVRKEAADEDVAALDEAVPEAAQLADEADDDDEAPAAGGGGLVGALGGALGGFGGGGLGGALGGVIGAVAGGGGAAGLIARFAKAGIGAGQATNFVQLIIDFVKQKAGSALVGRLVSQVPALKGLIG